MLQSIGDELTNRLALFVPAVPIVWTPPEKYVGLDQRYDAVKRISFFENFVPQIPEKYCITPLK